MEFSIKLYGARLQVILLYSEPLWLRTIFSGPTIFDKNAGIEHSL